MNGRETPCQLGEQGAIQILDVLEFSDTGPHACEMELGLCQ